MPAIMCAPILRNALKDAGGPPARLSRAPRRRPALGKWVATLIRAESTNLVVALNEYTYLTVVFPLNPVPRFRHAFAEMLAAALVDHDVAPARTAAECAQVQAARIVPLDDARLQRAIDTAGFVAGIEVCCCDSLREVQWNLNQFPHEAIRPFVPTQQVRLLFAGRRGHPVPSYSRRVSRLGNRDSVEAFLRTLAASQRITSEAAPSTSGPAEGGVDAIDTPGLSRWLPTLACTGEDRDSQV